MHSTTTTISRRTPVICKRRSGTESGRAASPTAPTSATSINRSGRRGGSMRTTRCAVSAIVYLRGEGGLDAVGKQQIVDVAVHFLERGRADVAEAQMIGVQLRLDAARMRREHQNA